MLARAGVLLVLLLGSWHHGTPALVSGPEPVATFSIVAWDPETGDLGVAVQSKFFSVGSVVPWAKAGVGAVATQARANTTFGPRGLELLRSGFSPEETAQILLKGDPEPAKRQFGIIDSRGRPAAWTGERCISWAGHTTGKHYSVQGNILAGPKVIEAMSVTFEATSSYPLADRLVAALVAGEEAGGDSRGRQSAALLVVRENGGYQGLNDRYIDLRVEDHADPIGELRRLLAIHHVINATDDARFHMERGDHEAGIRIMEMAAASRLNDEHASGDEKGSAYYNLGCFYSLAGKSERALDSLEKAFKLDPNLAAWSLNDSDLDSLRENPRYNALVEHARDAEP
jgi:uncharacterized Ntn-hydrolase superfamily protein